MKKVTEKEDQKQYDEYRNEDKQNIRRWFHIGISMKFLIEEWNRRHVEMESLTAIFNNKDIAWQFSEVLYSDEATVKQLYEAIGKIFYDECRRYQWRSYRWAAKELGVSVKVIELFTSAKLIRSVKIDNKTRVNGADVKAINTIKDVYPREFEDTCREATSYLRKCPKR
jgi:hypothetical protein